MVLTLLILLIFQTSAVAQEADKLPVLLTKRSSLVPNLTSEQKANLYDFVKTDPYKLIHADFKIPDYFDEATQFWFRIYTEFTSDNVVIHSRERHSIVLSVLDVTGLVDGPRAKKIAAERKRVTTILKHLAADAKTCVPKLECEAILKAIKDSRYTLPKKEKDREAFYAQLISEVRSQSGQKDIILQGLTNIMPFERKLNQIFEAFEVPGELIAVSFLESSFNTRAQSRVGATGVWQFMKRTGLQYFTITQKEDQRLNPLISTLGSLQLLKQNYKRLNRWDLSIWAYNSGPRHLIQARKQFKKDVFDLEYFLENYSHRRIGFASKSFFSSYLALVHALAYKKNLYYEDITSPLVNPLNIDINTLHFYVTKCAMKPSFIFNALKKTSPDIRQLNTHILTRYINREFQKGMIIVSDRPLTARRYYKVPIENYTNRYPKNWGLLVRNQSCSTR